MLFDKSVAERNLPLRRSAKSLLLLCLIAGLPGPAGAQNILNNGGFETGLMCYGFWTWSITGVDFAGDYQFTLSTDSHSGAYSLQIACSPGGTDCMRAACLYRSSPRATQPELHGQRLGEVSHREHGRFLRRRSIRTRRRPIPDL